jgi:hypothetical protein
VEAQVAAKNVTELSTPGIQSLPSNEACERPAATTSEASAAEPVKTAVKPQVAATEQSTPGIENSVIQLALKEACCHHL